MFSYTFELFNEQEHVIQMVIRAKSAPEAWVRIATEVLIGDIPTNEIQLTQTDEV